MPAREKEKAVSLQQIAAEVGIYPVEAYEFVRHGLSFTVDKIFGEVKGGEGRRHVSGQQLCQGLREYALDQWGMLARTVLRRWNITATVDFGKIVFSLVERNLMSTSPEDSIEDFRNVYDFKSAFEAGYRIECNV